eukprot:11868622-Alexandrium_andersonii.AAC.1
MSASLVGSEMCIRDRESPARLWARSPEGLQGSWVGAPTQSPDPVVIEEPVSYTHLTLPTICSV